VRREENVPSFIELVLEEDLEGCVTRLPHSTRTIWVQRLLESAWGSDPNLRAFLVERKKLLREKPDRFVAYENGQRIDEDQNRADLVKRVTASRPNRDIFVVQVSMVLRQVTFRSPGRVVRDSEAAALQV
jgi:hypothetical protein